MKGTLSRNSRTTDSPGAAKSAEPLIRLMPRPAACALSLSQSAVSVVRRLSLHVIDHEDGRATLL